MNLKTACCSYRLGPEELPCDDDTILCPICEMEIGWDDFEEDK